MFCGKAALDSIRLPEPIYRRIVTCINTPIEGFNHKTKKNGACYTREEKIQATRQQVILLVKNHYAKGAREDELQKIINYFIK